jgi:hypothetical protein
MEHVHEATYYRLKQYKGNCYEDIINNLCDVADGKRRRSSVVVTDTAILHQRLEPPPTPTPI